MLVKYFGLFLSFVPLISTELCLIQNKSQFDLSDNDTYKVVYCNPKTHDCCEDNCCRKDSPEIVLQLGRSRGQISVFVWFLVTLIVFGYFYFTVRFCYKKFYKERRNSTSFSRNNTQPQELNLMLSFNPSRSISDIEPLNFENLNNAHIHVPFIPTTPVTPPPAYVTLTPPPTYNVAIHFPNFHQEIKNETKAE